MVSTSNSLTLPDLYVGDDWRFSVPVRLPDCSDADLTHAELWLFLKTTAAATSAAHIIKVAWDDPAGETEGVFRVKVSHEVTRTIKPARYFLEAKRIYRSQDDASILDIATLIHDTKTPSLAVIAAIDLSSIQE